MNNDETMKVNWALQEAYKMAVHHAGITDWSETKAKDKFGTTQRHVEMMQIEIAKMLLSQLK